MEFFCIRTMIRNANFSSDKMNIIIKNSIDNITKCDIIFIEIKKMWKPKTVATIQLVTKILRLFNLNYSEPICCSRRLTFSL
nr:MAG TPA: hypothetical protein [Caudoviricetes sp.]